MQNVSTSAAALKQQKLQASVGRPSHQGRLGASASPGPGSARARRAPPAAGLEEQLEDGLEHARWQLEDGQLLPSDLARLLEPVGQGRVEAVDEIPHGARDLVELPDELHQGIRPELLEDILQGLTRVAGEVRHEVGRIDVQDVLHQLFRIERLEEADQGIADDLGQHLQGFLREYREHLLHVWPRDILEHLLQVRNAELLHDQRHLLTVGFKELRDFFGIH
mmetsp:Transcript_120681/g.341917  ORF Transcript_120681/g.341917 Transcript_120681/m.341917 type:complete len:222 (-) Transcript_120681:427-1092(-)